MCGRFALVSPPDLVRRHFGFEEEPWLPPRPVVRPTEPIAIVRRAERPGQVPTFALARWGFVPGFVKDFDAFRPIVNAPCEQIQDRASVRAAIRRRRCLIPADGFYLPGRSGSSEPNRCWARRRDGRLLGLAGLWETWAGADGSEIDTACIVTVAASADLAHRQDRMPALIEEADCALWLDAPELEADHAVALLRPSPPGTLLIVTAEDLCRDAGPSSGTV